MDDLSKLSTSLGGVGGPACRSGRSIDRPDRCDRADRWPRRPGRQAPRRRPRERGRLVGLDRAEPAGRPAAARPGARSRHRAAAVGGIGHRHRRAPAVAGHVPAPDHRHAHAGRVGAVGRPRRGRGSGRDARPRWPAGRAARWGRRRIDRPPARGAGAGAADLDDLLKGLGGGGRAAADPSARPGGRVGARPRGPDQRSSRASTDVHAGPRPASAATAGLDGDAAGMDATDLAAARVRRFLETEPVIWLSTIRADGAPHLVPTWFVWDGEAIVDHVEARGRQGPQPARGSARDAGTGDAESDFDVGLLEARAEVGAESAGSDLPAGFEAKYGDADPRARPHAGPVRPRPTPRSIRLLPVKALGWHGRTTPRSVSAAARRVAATGSASLAEPRRSPLDRLGEPLAVGLGGLALEPARSAPRDLTVPEAGLSIREDRARRPRSGGAATRGRGHAATRRRTAERPAEGRQLERGIRRRPIHRSRPPTGRRRPGRSRRRRRSAASGLAKK